jgi:hypothetical protein
MKLLASSVRKSVYNQMFHDIVSHYDSDSRHAIYSLMRGNPPLITLEQFMELYSLEETQLREALQVKEALWDSQEHRSQITLLYSLRSKLEIILFRKKYRKYHDLHLSLPVE